MKRVSGVAMACWLVLGLPCRGAAQSSGAVDEFRGIGQKILTESKVFPFLRSLNEGQTSPEPTVSLLATNDGTAAKARIGYLLTNIVSLDLSVSGPVSGGSAQLASHTGLGPGVSAEGALHLVLYQKDIPVPATFNRRATETASDAMLNKNGSGQILVARELTTPDYTIDKLVAAALNIATGIKSAGGPALAKQAARGAPLQALLANPAAVSAIQATPEELSKELDTAQGREAFATAFRLLANDMNLWKVKRSVVLSLGGTLSRPTFTVADGPEFRSVVKKAQTAEIALGLIESAQTDTLTRGYYAGLNVSTGRSFSGTARNTCLPIGQTGGTQCRNAVTKEPEPNDTELYQGDFRYFFDELKFAVGFRPGYDRKAAEHEKWSIEVPIMFLQNSKDLQSALSDAKAGLTGGVTLGVKDSPAGKSFFAVFSVGSLFKLPGLPH
jgi:hypothetical protein